MTSDDERLKALFECSAAEPSPFELTRMAARARELPTRLARVPRRLPRWSWAPAFAAFSALGALGVTLGQALSSDEEPSSPAALRTSAAPSTPPVEASGDPSARAAPAEAPVGKVASDDPDLDGLSLGLDDDDPFDLSAAEETELSP